MTKIRNVHFSPDEYLAGTMGMTHQERGLYWQVCTLIYSSGGAIPDDDERLFAGPDNPRTTRTTQERLIKKSKITRTGAELMVNRCRTELESASNRMRTAIESGAKGGRPGVDRQQNQRVTKPDPLSTEKLPTPTPTPTPTPVVSILEATNKKRGTSISPDWQPNEKDTTHATAKGISPKDIAAIAEHFRDFHAAKGTISKDWSASWRTWTANHVKFEKRDGRGKASGNNGRRGGIATAYRELVAEADDEMGIDEALRKLGGGPDLPHRLNGSAGDCGVVIDSNERGRVPQIAHQAEGDDNNEG